MPELDIDFGPGLNTVTGETGAGKSLIFGAIQLLAGGRATPASIRRGAKSCEVAGIFLLDANCAAVRVGLEARLEAASIPPCEENRLILRRVITESGSRAYVNGAMATAAFLRELSEHLIDIHGPHDNQTLMSPARQMALLDTYAGLTTLAADTRQAYERLDEIHREQEKIRADGLAPEEAGLLEYQLKEIERAAPTGDEEERLMARYRLVSNAKKLIELSASAQHALCDDEGSVAEQLASLLRSLRELSQLDPGKGAELVGELEQLAENVRDVGEELQAYAEGMEVDEEKIQRIEKRLDLLQRLKRKYGPTLADVIRTGERIRTRLESIRNMAERARAIADDEKRAREAFATLCTRLSAARAKAAPGLGQAITDKLRGLGFLKSLFEIRLTSTTPGPSGADGIDFMFAPNVGEDVQPLRHAASSGEVARVMLAIKTVLSDADSVPILVFDEIDANVGGRVAVSVADELRAVAARHQVFSITHLPQIAAAGQQHYLVAKAVTGERTSTTMRLIEGEARLDEVVRMLGADSGSATAYAHADELLRHSGGAATGGQS